MQIYINERPVDAQPGESLRAVVQRFDARLFGALESGAAYVTDGVGRPIDPSTDVTLGAIFRVVVSARKRDNDGAVV